MWFERRLTRRHHPLGAPLLLDAQLPNLLLPRMFLLYPPRLDPWLLHVFVLPVFVLVVQPR